MAVMTIHMASTTYFGDNCDVCGKDIGEDCFTAIAVASNHIKPAIFHKECAKRYADNLSNESEEILQFLKGVKE